MPSTPTEECSAPKQLDVACRVAFSQQRDGDELGKFLTRLVGDFPDRTAKSDI
jgi:hypothetical protein